MQEEGTTSEEKQSSSKETSVSTVSSTGLTLTEKETKLIGKPNEIKLAEKLISHQMAEILLLFTHFVDVILQIMISSDFEIFIMCINVAS